MEALAGREPVKSEHEMGWTKAQHRMVGRVAAGGINYIDIDIDVL